jgi:hypothetical protein
LRLKGFCQSFFAEQTFSNRQQSDKKMFAFFGKTSQQGLLAR